MSLARLDGLVTGRLRITDILEPDCASYGGAALPELRPVPGDKHAGTDKARDPWSTCACCGARIGWRVVVEDEGGNAWAMGRTCAARADGVATHDLARFEARADERGKLRRWARKHAEVLAELPHPFADRHPDGSAASYLAWVVEHRQEVRQFRGARRRLRYAVELAENTRAEAVRLDAAEVEVRRLAADYFRLRYGGDRDAADEVLDEILEAGLSGDRLQAAMDDLDPKKKATA